MFSLKISVSRFGLSDDRAAASCIVGIDVRSLVFLISITIIVKGPGSGKIDDTIRSQDLEAPFTKDVKEFFDECRMSLGVIPKMHKEDGRNLR
jgi:hypothetical protein